VRHTLVWIDGEPAIGTHGAGRLLVTTSVETDGQRLVAFY
jgi:hypothetical protein